MNEVGESKSFPPKSFSDSNVHQRYISNRHSWMDNIYKCETIVDLIFFDINQQRDKPLEYWA